MQLDVESISRDSAKPLPIGKLPTESTTQLTTNDVQVITKEAEKKGNPHRSVFQTMKKWIVDYRTFSSKVRRKLAQGIYAAACLATKSLMAADLKSLIVIDNIVIRNGRLPAYAKFGGEAVPTVGSELSDINIKLLAEAFVNLAQTVASMQTGGGVQVNVDRYIDGFAVYPANSPTAQALNAQIDGAYSQRPASAVRGLFRRNPESFTELMHKTSNTATQFMQGFGRSSVEKIGTLQCKAGDVYDAFLMNSKYKPV
ncbi:hypothetical protein H4R35_000385 [Dimargaris xerosporica]|nr:hypothetical protein H4R35_000385 [Dimargaris xerosporica]